MSASTTIAIIGAGMSGLAAAHTLLDSGYSVTIFEKSRGVGGRVATRQRDGFVYDHGAQYVKQVNTESIDLITERFRTDDLFSIAKPIWIFNQQGNIQEGDAKQNAEPRWCYRSGLTALANKMAEGLTIQLETRIARLQEANGWNLYDEAGQLVGHFDRVLVSIPASQVGASLEIQTTDPVLQERWQQALGKAQYSQLISVMLGYRPRPQERPYYALVNTDKGHAISWLAWEHEKDRSRVPEGAGLLLAQMAPDYSKEHYETADEELIRDVASRVEVLIGEKLPAPEFADVQRWRYALPTQKIDASTLNASTLPHGLAFCGDAFVGGRVQLALEHGIVVGQELGK